MHRETFTVELDDDVLEGTIDDNSVSGTIEDDAFEVELGEELEGEIKAETLDAKIFDGIIDMAYFDRFLINRWGGKANDKAFDNSVAIDASNSQAGGETIAVEHTNTTPATYPIRHLQLAVGNYWLKKPAVIKSMGTIKGVGPFASMLTAGEGFTGGAVVETEDFFDLEGTAAGRHDGQPDACSLEELTVDAQYHDIHGVAFRSHSGRLRNVKVIHVGEQSNAPLANGPSDKWGIVMDRGMGIGFGPNTFEKSNELSASGWLHTWRCANGVLIRNFPDWFLHAQVTVVAAHGGSYVRIEDGPMEGLAIRHEGSAGTQLRLHAYGCGQGMVLDGNENRYPMVETETCSGNGLTVNGSGNEILFFDNFQTGLWYNEPCAVINGSQCSILGGRMRVGYTVSNTSNWTGGVAVSVGTIRRATINNPVDVSRWVAGEPIISLTARTTNGAFDDDEEQHWERFDNAGVESGVYRFPDVGFQVNSSAHTCVIVSRVHVHNPHGIGFNVEAADGDYSGYLAGAASSAGANKTGIQLDGNKNSFDFRVSQIGTAFRVMSPTTKGNRIKLRLQSQVPNPFVFKKDTDLAAAQNWFDHNEVEIIGSNGEKIKTYGDENTIPPVIES